MDKDIQSAIIFISFLVLGFLAWYAPYGMTTVHSYPIAISAGDGNSRSSEAEWIRDSNQYDTLPPWFSNFKDNAQVQPPIHLILGASISQMTGYDVWEVFYFIGVLVWVGLAIAIYLLFAKLFNDPLTGIIASLLTLYPFQDMYTYQFLTNMYHTHYTVVFFPLIVFMAILLMQEITWRKSALLGFLCGVQFLTHSSETVNLLVAVGLVLVISYAVKTRDVKKTTIPLANIAMVAGIVFLVMVLLYIPLLYSNFFQGNFILNSGSFEFGTVIEAPPYEPTNHILTFLPFWAMIIFLVGVAISIKNKKYLPFVIIWGAYAVFNYALPAIGMSNYYLGIRSRNMYYLMVYPLLAIGIASILVTIKNAVKKEFPQQALVWGSAIILAVMLIIQAANSMPRQGVYSPDVYSGIRWMKDNTPGDSRVLCVLCNQYIGLPSQRVIMEFNINQESMQQFGMILSNQTDNRTFKFQYSGYSDLMLKQQGFFSFESRLHQANLTQDICNFEYYALVPFLPQSQQIVQAFGQQLIAKGSQVVYANNDMAIVKNAHVAGDCI